MNKEQYFKIVDSLLINEEVTFTYDKHFIYIQERVDGGYEGDIYESKEAYENDEECLDGGVCESIVACVVIEFFMDIARDLTKARICL